MEDNHQSVRQQLMTNFLAFLQNLPTIISVIATLITGYLTYRAAQSRVAVDSKQGDRTAEAALRDDLIETVRAYDERINKQDSAYNERFLKQDTKIVALQDEIYKLKTENLSLLQENLKLQSRVRELELELAKFENKVFYRSPPPTP
jgi:hypothetical protein